LASMTLIILLAGTAYADVVSDWNAVLGTAMRNANITTGSQTRPLAIMHAPMFDAVNGIARKYEPHFVTDLAPGRARQEAAAAQAAAQQLFPDRERTLAVESSLRVIEVLDEQIASIEKQVLNRIKPEAGFQNLQTVYGIGPILAMTIWLETGDIGRFHQVGDYASYCRCVASTRISNAKKKGENNSHNGNPYLAWAYVEAATYAARFYRQATRFVERKTAQVNRTLAIKALAHKLARACYYVLRDGVVFEPSRLLGS
jgi:transposase